MTDERTGIDLLRRAVGEVAASLPPPRRARRPALRPVAWVLAGAAVVIAALVIGHPLRQEAPSRPLVEVVSLRIQGRETRARIVESAAAGSIVVVPSRQDAQPGKKGDLR